MMNTADIGVLLVDDDFMIRECVGAYLEDEGFQVYGAESGEAALLTIATVRPTVCISDMRLPGISGEEFILQAFVLCPETRFMLHTGMMYSLSDELRQIGMTREDVLLKPLHDLAKLVIKIKCSAAGRPV
jgi:DNA-binding response OmpR family regulator